MYEKDKRQRITLRLNDEQFSFIKSQTDVLGITPSDYIRMLVNAAVFAGTQGGADIREALGRENDKADIDG